MANPGVIALGRGIRGDLKSPIFAFLERSPDKFASLTDSMLAGRTTAFCDVKWVAVSMILPYLGVGTRTANEARLAKERFSVLCSCILAVEERCNTIEYLSNWARTGW